MMIDLSRFKWAQVAGKRGFSGAARPILRAEFSVRPALIGEQETPTGR
jgi:hypothetical protein